MPRRVAASSRVPELARTRSICWRSSSSRERAFARYQLDRVAAAWATDTKRDPAAVRGEIEKILAANAHAPLGGLWGVDMVNVLEVNLALRTRYGEPGASPAS